MYCHSRSESSAGRYAGGSRKSEREDEPNGAAVRDQGAAHSLAVFNIKKVLLRGEDRLDLFSLHYCHERQVEERGPEGEQVEDKEEEQLRP